MVMMVVVKVSTPFDHVTRVGVGPLVADTGTEHGQENREEEDAMEGAEDYDKGHHLEEGDEDVAGGEDEG